MSERVRYRWLNFHLPYACRHSGACCSSGWPIPVERNRARDIERALATRRVRQASGPWLIPVDGAPEDIAGTLAIQPGGQCAFFRLSTTDLLPTSNVLPTSNTLPANDTLPAGGASEGGCGIYLSRPSSCSHFPYVCLIDQRGVHVTLSHYCPTAASLLFEHEGAVEIVEGPSPIAGLEIPEGLDARESLPPLESPAMLMSLDQFSQWEGEQVHRFPPSRPGAASADFARLHLFDSARSAVSAPLSWPEAPPDLDMRWRQFVEPEWDQFQPVVGRYLAAKVFASWAAYLGDGTTAVMRSVEQARVVLQVEAIRQCATAGRALDAALLKEAIRRSDLLLVHYADPGLLVNQLV